MASGSGRTVSARFHSASHRGQRASARVAAEEERGLTGFQRALAQADWTFMALALLAAVVCVFRPDPSLVEHPGSNGAPGFASPGLLQSNFVGLFLHLFTPLQHRAGRRQGSGLPHGRATPWRPAWLRLMMDRLPRHACDGGVSPSSRFPLRRRVFLKVASSRPSS